MLTCIFVDLQVFYSHSWKSRLLVAFLVLLVVFFMLGWSYFGRIFTKSRSSFGRIFSNIWSYFYLTTLLFPREISQNTSFSPRPLPPLGLGVQKKIASHWLMSWCAKKSRLSLVRRATQCRQLRTRSYELACVRQHLCTDSSCGFDCTVHSLRWALLSELSQGVELSLGVYHRLG